MKKHLIFFLLTNAFVNFILFGVNRAQDVFIPMIHALVAIGSLIVLGIYYTGNHKPKTMRRKGSIKHAYHRLSTPNLLKLLQDLNEKERLIEKELQVRFPENNLLHVA